MAEKKPAKRKRSAGQKASPSTRGGKRPIKLGAKGKPGKAAPSGSYNLSAQNLEKARKPASLAPSKRRRKSRGSLPKGLRRVLRIVVSVFALLCILWVADGIANFGKIHSGVFVGSVDVGGMSISEASAEIERVYAEKLASSEAIVFSDEAAMEAFDPAVGYVAPEAGSTATSWQVGPSTIDAYVDGEALAKSAYEATRSANPVISKLKAVFGGVSLPAYVSSDYEKFHTLVSNINDSAGTYPVDADIEIFEGSARVTAPSDGMLVDELAFLESLSQALLENGEDFIAPFKTASYSVDTQAAQALADDVNAKLAQEVEIEYQDNLWTLGSSEIGSTISTEVLTPNTLPTLSAYVDSEKVSETFSAVMGEAGAAQGATDAYFDTSQGYVNLIPSSNGVGPDYDRAANELEGIVFGGQENHKIKVYQTEVVPELTTEEAQEMGITDELSIYTMSNASAYEEKLHNMALACDTINYTLVAPGETFSWNGLVGDTTTDKGYQEGHAVVDGELQSSIGGGICQVATTMFNAVYEAGLQIDERHNHSMYFTDYPEGRDATISYGIYDLKWTNDTDNWILVEMHSDESNAGYIYCQLWGTATGRSVTTDYGEWQEGEDFEVKEVADSSIPSGSSYVEQGGSNGRSITIWRHVFDAFGTEIRTDTFSSYYSPTTQVVHVGTG